MKKSKKQIKAGHKKTVCFYFQVHQPYRLKNFNFFQTDDDFFQGPDQATNRDVFEKVAKKCYLPANGMFLELLKNHPEFKISFSLSGVFLEQCQEFGEIGQKVLESFQELVKTGQVELLSETYYHSLSFLFSKKEFAEQILKHRKLIKKLFNQTPKVYRNTELIYNNEIGQFIKKMGFSGMLIEGWEKHLKSLDKHSVLKPVNSGLHPADLQLAEDYGIAKPKDDFGLLLKDYKLADDIAFRFGNKHWNEFPLTAEKYANWVDQVYGETINLFMDYETFGEHQWEDTGIFEFIRHLPAALLKKGIGFATPSETLDLYPRRGELDCHFFMSWADLERDLSAWTGNKLQDSAIKSLFDLEPFLDQLKNSKTKISKNIVDAWRKLQTSDHFYYMCLKYWQDGDVHKYFSPYDTPYDAYVSFMNVLARLKEEVQTVFKKLKKRHA